MRGLIYNEVEDKPKPRTLIHNAGYREDGARNFLSSNNVSYSRVSSKRGPGRPPKIRPPGLEQPPSLQPISSID